MYYRPGGRNEKDKYAYSYLTVEQYLKQKCKGKNLGQFFKFHGYEKIAIYGIGDLGEIIYEDISRSDINIEFFIDRNYKNFSRGYGNIPVIDIKDIPNQSNVDAILISPIFLCNDIIDNLLKVGCKLEQIVNLTDAVYGLEEI